METSDDALLYELEDDLHDLCQPLTALHFRLELGRSDGELEGLREAVDGALGETTRLIESIKRMRERVMAMKTARRIPGGEVEPRRTVQSMKQGGQD